MFTVFNIFTGLSADGCIVVEPIDSESVCVLLLELTSNPSGGFILAPANFDLPCFINESEELTGEINLINGKFSSNLSDFFSPHWATALKILGTHINFFWKKYNFMHFER